MEEFEHFSIAVNVSIGPRECSTEAGEDLGGDVTKTLSGRLF